MQSSKSSRTNNVDSARNKGEFIGSSTDKYLLPSSHILGELNSFLTINEHFLIAKLQNRWQTVNRGKGQNEKIATKRAIVFSLR